MTENVYRQDNDLHLEASRRYAEEKRNAERLAQWRKRWRENNGLILFNMISKGKDIYYRPSARFHIRDWIVPLIVGWLAFIGLYTVFSWLSEWLS